MWRREEGLKYFFSGKPAPSPAEAVQNHASGREGRNPGKKWSRLRFKSAVRESSLDFSCPDIHSTSGLNFPVSVKDGIGRLDSGRDDRDTCPFGDIPMAVNDICLLQQSTVDTLKLPESGSARISQVRVGMNSRCRWARTEIGPVRVRFTASMQFRMPLVGGGGGVFPERFPVHSSIRSIGSLPIRRCGIDFGELQESVSRACQAEAGKNRGLPLDRCRLIALFRHIPVEMVSRLHYFGEKGEIEYTLFPSPQRSQTRVYDLIAVQDLSSDEVHLVPYAIQSRTVCLG
jgi:hypothetical protein